MFGSRPTPPTSAANVHPVFHLSPYVVAHGGPLQVTATFIYHVLVQALTAHRHLRLCMRRASRAVLWPPRVMPALAASFLVLQIIVINDA